MHPRDADATRNPPPRQGRSTIVVAVAVVSGITLPLLLAAALNLAVTHGPSYTVSDTEDVLVFDLDGNSRAQLHTSGASVSLNSTDSTRIRLEQGSLSVRQQSDAQRMFLWPSSEDALRLGGLYVAVLFGILARGVHEQLPGARKVHIPRLLGRVVQSPGFVRSVFVSPLVLLAAYELAGGYADQVVAVLLAFQNGFFWQTVLSAKSAPVELQPQAEAAPSRDASSAERARGSPHGPSSAGEGLATMPRVGRSG